MLYRMRRLECECHRGHTPLNASRETRASQRPVSRRERDGSLSPAPRVFSETGLFMRLNKTFLNGDLPGCRKRLWTQMVVEALLQPSGGCAVEVVMGAKAGGKPDGR